MSRLPPGIDQVELRRSARRRRTVSARIEGNKIVVFLPAGMGAGEEQDWVNKMVARLGERQQRPVKSDEELMRRALQVAASYLDDAAGRELRPSSVRWVSNMNYRWGSCSTDSGAIRVSDRLQQLPEWVLDYVLAHELAHLVHASHGRRFNELVAAYPLTERARGYLEGWSQARSQPAPGVPAEPS